MIHVKRKPMPKFMSTDDFRRMREELADFYLAGGTRELQERFPVWKLLDQFMPETLDALRRQFNNKCAYTEVAGWDPDDSSQQSYKGDVPPPQLGLLWHRPISDAVSPSGEVFPRHYWWLTFRWVNWYLASNHVESIKSFQFPVVAGRSNVPKSATGNPKTDKGLLLDPCIDYPAWWLHFDANGGVSPRDHPSPLAWESYEGANRGEETIKLLDLNHQDILQTRSRAVRSAQKRLEGDAPSFEAAFEWLYDAASPHIGAVAQVAARTIFSSANSINPSVLARHVTELLKLAPDAAAVELADTEIAKISSERKRILRPIAEFAEAQYPDVLATSNLGDLVPRRRKAVATKTAAPVVQKAAAPPAMIIESSDRITSILVHDFRAIRNAQIDIPSDLIPLLGGDAGEPSPIQDSAVRWKVLLGENGSGKSSFLQAVALALSGPNVEEVLAAADLKWSDILRRADGPSDTPAGRVLLRFTGGKKIDLRFDRDSYRFWGLGKGAPEIRANVRAYGATRLLGKPEPDDDPAGDTPERLTSVEVGNLFDPAVTVMDAKTWLLNLDGGPFNTAALTLGELLGDQSSLDPAPRIAAKQRVVRNVTAREIRIDGDRIEDVSDGYRSVVAVVCDIMAGIGGLHLKGGGYSDLAHARGIVLIDEIGAHLHPRWRMEITGKLRNALPNVQFLVTTHEPLCLRGLYEREVVRVAKYREYGVAVDEIEKAPARYRVDQLLTSEFFGLDSAIDPIVDQKFQRYYQLRQLGALDGDQQKEFFALDKELNQRLRPVLGYTRRDQLIYEAIDEFLQDRGQAALPDPDGRVDQTKAKDWLNPEERQQRRRDTIEKVKHLWAEAAGSSGASES